MLLSAPTLSPARKTVEWGMITPKTSPFHPDSEPRSALRHRWTAVAVFFFIFCISPTQPIQAGESGEEQTDTYPSAEEQTHTLKLKTPIELGTTAQGAPELVLRWLELNDSRCPEGLQCFVAGQAQLRIEVSRTGHDPGEIILVLAAGRRLGQDDAEATVGPFHIELKTVEPYPVAGNLLPEEDRWATLSIHRQGETERE